MEKNQTVHSPKIIIIIIILSDIFRDGGIQVIEKLFFCLFGLFRAAPMAYGGSQAKGQIGAAAAGLHHSHSNAGSEPHL